MQATMSAAPAAEPARAALRDGEARGLLDVYYGGSPLAMAFGAVGAALLALVLASSEPGPWWWPWLLAVQALFATRFVLSMAYLRGGRERRAPRFWRRLAASFTVVQGLLWGAMGLSVLWLRDPLLIGAVVAALLAMTAGSAAMVGSLPVLVPLFGGLTLLPMSVALLGLGGAGHAFLAFCCLIFLGTTSWVLPRTVRGLVRQLHRTVVERERMLKRLEGAEDMARVSHFSWDAASGRTELSVQARRLFGLPEDAVRRPADVVATVVAADRDRVRELTRQAVREGRGELRFETRLMTPAGERDVQAVQRSEFDEQGRALWIMTTLHDITPLKQTQRELHSRAYTDALTGLANRAAFHEALHRLVQGPAPVPGAPGAGLLLLDLDHFKSVNDTLGHEAGDRLLCEVAQRLKGVLRDGDLLARLGGDEFAIVLPRLENRCSAARVAARLGEVLAQALRIDELELHVTCSIGIAMYPEDASAADALLRCADVAMYEAKSHGRAGYQFHNHAQGARTRDRVRLEADLRRAIERGELTLHYQPKVALADGRLIGAEALLRWQHQELGAVSPERFIPVAEDTGLILPIGDWVLRQACATAAAWNVPAAPGAPLKVAVNLSPRQIWAPDFVGSVRTVLRDTGCRPEWIELEMTESLLLDTRGTVAEALGELRRIGFTLAIDDFGTGYSALGYLTRFPITTLKIDRSFVSDMAADPVQASIVRAVAGMGRSLGLELVAEGVEHAEQAAVLREMGCHQAQGWLYGRPMDRLTFEQTEAARMARLGAHACLPGPTPLADGAHPAGGGAAGLLSLQGLRG